MDALRDLTSIDVAADAKLLHQCRELSFVVSDSWTLPWLYKGGDTLRIYLDPPLEARAEMAYASKQGEKIVTSKLRELIRHKDKTSKARFYKLYGFDITSSVGFDLVLDNSLTIPEETSHILIKLVDKELAQ